MIRARTSARALAALAALAVPTIAQVRAPLDAPLVVADKYQQIVKTLDLNGDGWMDAFGWWTDSAYGLNPGQGEMHGWINDGTGRLVLAWNDPYANSIYDPLPVDACDVGDLDGDGDDDMVLVANQRIRVYLSQGAQSPVLAIEQVHGQAQALELADFDGDGARELVVAGSGGLTIYAFQLAQGQLQALSSLQTNFAVDGRIVVAELTGDATPDVLQSGARVYPVVGMQLQPFSLNAAQPWTYSAENSKRHNAADLDGDGDVDFMTFNVDQSTGVAQYRIVRRTGPSTFAVEPPQDGGPARRLVDIDGDGDLDGVCCGGGGTPVRSTNSSPSMFRVSLNDGTGAFAPSISIPGVGSQAIAGAADLDHDGDMDLVAGRCVYYAQGPITAHPCPVLAPRPLDARTIVDLDADGDPDLLPASTSVRRNRGDGAVEQVPIVLAPQVPGTTYSGEPIAGDWDGDGDEDLLARLSGGAGLELQRNVGCGVFQSAGVVAGTDELTYYPTMAEDALAADVDGDGDLDLVLRTRTGIYVANYRSGWWSNDGAQGFTWRQTFGAVSVTHVADVNGDAVPDLLGISSWNYQLNCAPIVWVAGLGAGTFGTWQSVPFSDLRILKDSFDVGDLDGDGDLDIAAPLWGASSSPEMPGYLRAHVYSNDGAGTFTRAAVSTENLRWGHATPLTAAIGDLNGDALPDLAFGPFAMVPTGVMLVMRRSDNAGWEEPVLQTAFDATSSQTTTSHFALRDVDGDGDEDLLCDRLVRNTREQGEDGGVRLQVHEGIAGQGGIVPLFGARGPFRLGEAAQLRLRGLRPGATGRFHASYPGDPPAAPLGGGILSATRYRIYATIPFTASGSAGDPAGSGTFTLDFTVPAYAIGRTTSYRALVDDPDAPLGVAWSNRLDITYGP